jgi:hypothetical protein
MSPTLEEYAQHVERITKVFWLANTPWAVLGGVLRPLSPPHLPCTVERSCVYATLRSSAAHLAMWSIGWDTPPCDWWYICCDRKDYDIQILGKGKRRHVRRGLEQCEIRRVEPNWFARHGYPVYAAAFRGYGKRPPMTEASFFATFKRHAEYPGRETWGAFLDEQLVAWVSCLIVEDSVIQSSGKSHPSFLHAHPNEALIYTLTRHYLCDRKYRYVTGGARRLAHDTRVQDFLLEMGYRRIGSHLKVELTRPTALLSSLHLDRVGFRLGLAHVMKEQFEKIQAVSSAIRIARACARHADVSSP